MSVTDTEPAVALTASGPRPPVPEWRVAIALARREGLRLARALLVPFVLTLLMAGDIGGGPVLDLRALSYGVAFGYLLPAAVTLVVSHRAVTRSRRDGSEELLSTTPATGRSRTGAHLLALAAPAVLALAVLPVVAWRADAPVTVGSFVVAEFVVGPVLVVGAGCLGVLLARVWPQRFTPYLACVAIAVLELAINTPRLGGSGFRWLAFWVEPSLWWALPRPSWAHLVYLLGLVAMAAVGALLRHGLTRALVAVAVVSIAVTTAAASAQMRQPQDHWRRANAYFAEPAAVQRCSDRAGVRYCSFPGFGDLEDHWADMATEVRRVLPAAAWPSDLAVTQRVTALDFQYVGDSPKWLPHLPAMPRDRIRQPDDGEIHPGIEAGWSWVQPLGFGVQVASAAIGLPLVPAPDTGAVCNAAGQARGVVALWAGAHAVPDGEGILRILVARVEQAAESGSHSADVVFPVSEVDVYGGFVVSPGDARAALRLLDHRDAAAKIRERWTVVVDPATTTSELITAVGIPAGTDGDEPAPGRPVLSNLEPEAVTLGSPCN